MTWYCASVVYQVEAIPQLDGHYAIESLFVLEAPSVSEAENLAREIGVNFLESSSPFFIGAHEVTRTFVGVRRIATIYNESDDVDQRPPSNRSELITFFYQAESAEIGHLIVNRRNAVVEYVEEFGMDSNS